MPRITNGDQIAHILRARLQKMNAKPKTQKASRGENVEAVRNNGIPTLAELIDDEEADEAEIRERVVRQFLLDEFGDDITGGYAFPDLVKTVAARLGQDPQTDKIFRDALAELKDGRSA